MCRMIQVLKQSASTVMRRALDAGIGRRRGMPSVTYIGRTLPRGMA